MKLALSKKNLWDLTPRPLKNTLGLLFGSIPSSFLLGRNFRQNASFVETAQWWSREKSQEYQVGKLRDICTLAFEKTKYYKRLFLEHNFDPKKLKNIDEFRNIPIIDRDIVNIELENMITTSTKSMHVDYMTTGGTGGRPLRFYINADRSAIEYPYLISGWKRVGYELGVPLAILRGSVVRQDKHGMHHEYDPILRHHYYSSFHLTDETMHNYIEHIREIGPCFLHVYPSSAETLARFMKRQRIKALENIRGILAESENLYPEQRKFIERVFRCRMFSSYGHTEKLVAAAECEQSTNYHVWPTYGCFELIDESGNLVTKPGTRGEIVGTGFINRVMPFIRYRTGDFATFVGERCEACGREQPIIADIRGHRIQEDLIAVDGSLISWAAVNVHDDTFDNVRQFQFYQDTPGQAVLRVVPSSKYTEQDEMRIIKNLGRKFEKRLKFSIKLVNRITLTERGKTIFVEQRIPIQESLHKNGPES